jgi:hypothetical protein
VHLLPYSIYIPLFILLSGQSLTLRTSRFALGNLGRLHLELFNDIPATQAMRALGLSNELQTSLLDPRFSQVFQSEKLHY